MKQDIHPKYYLTQVHCACGHSFEVGGGVSELKVEICSACHPFYTGKQKHATKGGRIERFKKKYGM